MKKSLLFVLSLMMATTFVACKSKQSNYKSAYEVAKEKEGEPQPAAPVTQPAVAEPVPATPVTPAISNVSTRKEKVTVVNQSSSEQLKQFSVCVGVFANKTNAEGLKAQMDADGFKSILVLNEAQQYRVLVTTFDSKDKAVISREEIKARYSNRFQDAWILERQ